MAFWTDATLQDPKRKFRWQVQLLAFPGAATWFAKAVTKPKITIKEANHNYLNHTFYYPGRTEWSAVDVTLVDPVQPDAVANTMAIIQNAGYIIPKNSNDRTTMSKQKAVTALQGVRINQIDAEGGLLEQWILNNAFITSADIGSLDYTSDDLLEVKLTFRYDWAECFSPIGANLVPPSGPFFNSQNFFKQ